MSVWTLLQLLLLCVCVSTQPLERVEQLTCGQAVADCEVRAGSPTCICDDDQVSVSRLDAQVVPCQEHQVWSLCLQILLNITIRDVGESDGSADEDLEEEEEEEGDQDNITSSSSVGVCYTSPSGRLSRRLRFTFQYTALQDSGALQGWMCLVVRVPKAEWGSPVVVHSPHTNSTKHLMIPSQEEVCSRGLDAVFCKGVPRLRRRTDRMAGAFVLYVADADKWRQQEFSVCQRQDRNGGCLKVEWNNASHEFEVSFSSVAPCLCFEIWGNFPRTEYCPFLNETAFSGSRVSVSLSESAFPHGPPAVLWSISAPCRLQAELWLCVKDRRDGSCQVLSSGSHIQTRLNHSWIQTDHTHWQLQGEFLHVQRHPSLCVQVKVAGVDGHLGPVCPFEVRRKHWSFPLVLCVVLVCLSVLGFYAVQGPLKSWVFRWLKEDEVNLLAGVELLLISPPDVDGSVSQLMCRLSSSLSALGFRVSLDLWSQSEIAAVGPAPWLHSCLDEVRRRGGKAVLAVTQAACERAEEWSCRGAPEEEEMLVHKGVQFSTCPGVFDASLSCVLADCLLGRATGRFVLVRFDGRCPALALPELFRGLPVFSLPCQSLGFIQELTRGALPGRWVLKRARALRAASRALSGALRETDHNKSTTAGCVL